MLEDSVDNEKGGIYAAVLVSQLETAITKESNIAVDQTWGLTEGR